MMIGALKTALLFCVLLAVGVAAVAQETNSTTQLPADGPRVKLGMLITKKSKAFVDDITKEELQLFEDKVPQTVSSVAKDERAVDYGVVIDTSGSFKFLLVSAIETAKVLIRNNRPTDETFIERFISNDIVETVQEFTSDQDKLIGSLGALRVENGQSAVVDAVYVAVEHTSQYHRGADRRRALVLITDGEDRASYYSADDLFKLVRASDVQIFVIGIVVDLDNESGFTRPSPRATAEKLLNRLAQESGGRVFFPANMVELRQAASEIVQNLHAQYLIDYQSTNSSNKPGFRKVEIRVAKAPGQDKLTVIARPGYLVGPEASSPKKDAKKKKSE